MTDETDNQKANKAGGRRPGSGRKVGTGNYLEATSVLRVPVSQKPVLINFLEAYAKKQRAVSRKENLDEVGQFEQLAKQLSRLEISLYQSKVPAGFPSPADDHVEKRLDPNEYLIDQEESTFFVTIQGESMIEAGMMPGDKAVVDKSKTATVGDIVLAMVDGEFTIKTLAKQKDGKPKLLPANSSGKYTPILITDVMQFEIFGVVIGSFRRFR
jgi:DNA polymerase V